MRAFSVIVTGVLAAYRPICDTKFCDLPAGALHPSFYLPGHFSSGVGGYFMLRAFFVNLSENRSLRSFAERSAIGRRVSGRFVAGTEIADAVRVTQAVNRAGMSVSIDNLGENVTNPDEARAQRAALPADARRDRRQPTQRQYQPQTHAHGTGCGRSSWRANWSAAWSPKRQP